MRIGSTGLSKKSNSVFAACIALSFGCTLVPMPIDAHASSVTNAYQNRVFRVVPCLSENVRTERIDSSINKMVRIGVKGKQYQMPVGSHDDLVKIDGGFEIAATEQTFAEYNAIQKMKTIRDLKNKKGYTFKFRPAHVYKDKLCPATGISYADAIVFANAKSLVENLDPVYHTANGNIITSTTEVNNRIRIHKKSGYRLPSREEFEFAARFLGENPPKDGQIAKDALKIKSFYFMPRNYMSGAKDTSAAEINAVSSSFGPVARKRKNLWGIYDLNGNAPEFVEKGTPTHVDPVVNGELTSALFEVFLQPEYAYDKNMVRHGVGFRLARDSVSKSKRVK